jgi:SNF2 family DNA or RNA helicase
MSPVAYRRSAGPAPEAAPDDPLVLHGGFREGRFVFWAERPGPPARGRARGPSRPPRHPFSASARQLAASLQQAVTPSGSGPPPLHPAELVVWLPSASGRPLGRDAGSGRGEPLRLAPWLVEGVDAGWDAALRLLAGLGDAATLRTPEFLLGPDVRFWGQAARFALALVVGQSYLPWIEEREGAWRAVWRAVTLGADGRRLRRLAEAMPGACRAVGPDGDRPPDVPPLAVLEAFCSAVADHLVRTAARSLPPPVVPRRQGRRAAFDSVHDQWLHALWSPEGGMAGEPGELAALAEQLRGWARPLSLAEGPVRLCFRLEEPEGDGGQWFVRYLLQAADDPSLLVPAEEVWRAGSRLPRPFSGLPASPRELLLAELARAAGVCPEVEESLRKTGPVGFPLDTAGAFAFLTRTAWLLDQAGFGVLLPAWWTGRNTVRRLTARARVQGPGRAPAGMGLDAVVDVDWEVALGEEVLTEQELEALARLKSPLVKVRGQWVQLGSEDVQAALRLLRGREAGRLRLRDVVHMALGAAPDTGRLAVAGVRAEGWVGELLARLEGGAAYEEVPAPAGLRGTLRPYQLRGYSWLRFLTRWGLGACLADDMGLGKTVQTLALIQRDWEEEPGQPVLLVCPTSVVGNWRKEAERFTPDLPVLVHHGADRHRGEDFRIQAERHALVISSYGLLQRDAELLRQVRWRGVVLDEAQNVKNAGTAQARAARSLTAGYRIALTGTPVENHVGELWSLMDFLNPGLLGTQADFRRRFFLPIQTGRDAEAAARLRRLTRPFLLRRLKTDPAIVPDLPEKMEIKVFCTLTREQASLYAAVLRQLEERLGEVEGMERRGLILATLTRLKQVCNHPAHFLADRSPLAGRSGKLARLEEMLAEVLAAGERALVFTQFAEMGALLQRRLRVALGCEVLLLHGGTPKAERDRMVERFQSDPDGPPVFVLSLKAGGTGLNLTRANHVFHFDRWWNPAVENQATDRAYRIGQSRAVQVHKLVCAGTLEEKIDALIERKRGLAADVVGSGEEWLTELSSDEIRRLFALEPEAVAEEVA